MKKALLELKKINIDIDSLVVNYVKSDSTCIKDNTLYYKNIPEGLFLLVNTKFNDLKELNNSFESFGTMIDVSRGAVFKVNYIKELIYKKALMGLNELWLYIEDIYPLEDVPTFGYNRGKYSSEELNEIVEYAELFGVDLVPCIQSLGHHGQFLRWPNSAPYKDMDQVLLANEESIKLVGKMIAWAKKHFKSSKIHLGMDETFGLGFGNYFKKYGFKQPIEIFTKQLKAVNQLALEAGFEEIMIWSDMFFRFLSETEYYYDTSIKLTKEIIDNIPENITLVYWDYYNWKDDIVKNMLLNHLEINRKIVFASGTWIWTRFTYDKKQTDRTAKMHLEKSLEVGVNNFIMTQWMDDGAYGNHKTTMLGVYELACDLYTGKYDEEVFNFITNTNYQDSLVKASINESTMHQVGILWDDPILNIYVNNFIGNDISNIDSFIDEQKSIMAKFNEKLFTSFEYTIMEINLNKLELSKLIKTEYLTKDITKKALPLIDSIIKGINYLNDLYSKMWNEQYKLFGLEIVQARLGAQLIRHKELARIVENYQKGDIIDVFEEVIVKDQFLSLKYNELAFSLKPF